ncbi:MAG: NUDIX hydrolase [Bacteroidales bacterium]
MNKMENKDAVFCIFHTENLIFMQMRAKNGTWGLPGGMVEPDESLFGALAREVAEEINTSIQLSQVEYISSHIVRQGLTSHVFTCKVSHDHLLKIAANALSCQASHSEELNGIGIFDIDRQYFYNMPLAPTLREELETVFGNRLRKEI